MLVAGLAQQWHDWYLALMFPVTIAGGAVMTLAWGLLFKLTPPEHRGTISGLATTTKGFGLIIGPIAAGRGDGHLRPLLRVDGRLPAAVADPRDSDPRRDPARAPHGATRAVELSDTAMRPAG